MSMILGIVVDGFAYGMILFMISIGLSVTMGLMRVINLAHGSFALVGGALAHLMVTRWGIPYFLAVLFALAGVVLLAVALERAVYRRIYRLGELEQVLATIGITFMVIAAVNFGLGSTLLALPLPPSMTGSISLGFKTLPFHRVIVILVGLVVVVALYTVIERTRFGIFLRAAVDNRDIAATLGIDTPKIYMAAFALGAGLACLGGILGAELLPLEAYYPLRYMVLFLIVVGVGGLGNITGSLMAAIGLGILDTAARYLIPDMGTIFFYLAIMVILVLRPNGLLGRA